MNMNSPDDQTQPYSDGQPSRSQPGRAVPDVSPTQSYTDGDPARISATRAYADGAASQGSAGGAASDGRTLLHGLGPGDEADLPSGTVTVEAVVAGDAGTGHRATGEAAVYRVRTESGETRALKLYRAFEDPRHEPNPEALARIQAIDDADVLRLYDFGTGERKWRGRFCYELAAFAKGGTMLAHGDGTPFETEDLRAEYTPKHIESNTVPQLFLGLRRLHGLRIVHGDLKPENVFYVDPDGEDLVIGDYGSAKTFSEADADLDVRATSVVKGTSLYVAPEQANNIISPANDYFSLGMMVFHLLYPDALTDVRTTRRTIRERMVRGEEVWPFDSSFGRLNDLVGGLTLLDPQRRWGESEVREWVSGGSPRVRYASQDARTDPFRLGPGVAFHTGADAAAYVGANPGEWYETLIEDGDSYRLLREWLLKTEGPQRKKYFEGVVKHYQSKGRTLLTEAVLRYFDPYRPIPLGPEVAPFDPASPSEAAAAVGQFLADAVEHQQRDWCERALLALELALEEVSQQGSLAASAILERARTAVGVSPADAKLGRASLHQAVHSSRTFDLARSLGEVRVSKSPELIDKWETADSAILSEGSGQQQMNDLWVCSLAAETGSPRAKLLMGNAYHFGWGVEQDDRQANDWYRKAAEVEQKSALFNLGNSYQYGRGVAQDHVEAVRWYKLAADAGSVAALHSLGLAYRNGDGVPKDEAEGLRWYHAAADRGHSGSQYNLGQAYRNGWGCNVDNGKAAQFYRLAAEQGVEKAQLNLGYMYSEGMGVPRDKVKAIEWYRLAAEQGNVMALRNLGLAYQNGEGVRQSDTEAAVYFAQAAELGDAPSQFTLGASYVIGRGVPEDRDEGVRWIRSAAAQGYQRAVEALETL